MNQNNQMILNEQDIVKNWLTQDNIATINSPDSAVFENIEPINIYNEWCKAYNIDDIIECMEPYKGDDFVEKCIQNWNMPDEYTSLDIVTYLVSMCKSKEEENRVLEELLMFKERGMLIVLRFLKYLVDTCNENDIVLGVGRGSSVASYCLYLLGVHRIDSIKYNLDIKEFLK